MSGQILELSDVRIGADTVLVAEHNLGFMNLVERLDDGDYAVMRVDSEGKQYGELHISEWYLLENTHIFAIDLFAGGDDECTNA